MTNIIAVEMQFDGQERLVELTKAATGNGWIYKPSQFTTTWRKAGTYSAVYMTREGAEVLTNAVDDLKVVSPEGEDWCYSAVLIGGEIFEARRETVIRDGEKHHWATPRRGEDYYRAYWSVGTPDDVLAEARDVLELDEEPRSLWVEDDEEPTDTSLWVENEEQTPWKDHGNWVEHNGGGNWKD